MISSVSLDYSGTPPIALYSDGQTRKGLTRDLILNKVSLDRTRINGRGGSPRRQLQGLRTLSILNQCLPRHLPYFPRRKFWIGRFQLCSDRTQRSIPNT